ncbi:basic salivary proline-rich protein 3-like [Dama dama]|uniref:basic salivary proline-rich protein 3-like n=1 Tax=Dama dama TaxID=30532 RepID=UPI002A361E82|nr:basic salivary proline-rich protein 3-like [Dama dama]
MAVAAGGMLDGAVGADLKLERRQEALQQAAPPGGPDIPPCGRSILVLPVPQLADPGGSVQPQTHRPALELLGELGRRSLTSRLCPGRPDAPPDLGGGHSPIAGPRRLPGARDPPEAGAACSARPLRPPPGSPRSLGTPRGGGALSVAGPGLQSIAGRGRGEEKGDSGVGPGSRDASSANLRALTRGAAPRRSDICPPAGAPGGERLGREGAAHGERPLHLPRTSPAAPRALPPSAPLPPSPRSQRPRALVPHQVLTWGPKRARARERRALPWEPPLRLARRPPSAAHEAVETAPSLGSDCAARLPPPPPGRRAWAGMGLSVRSLRA